VTRCTACPWRDMARMRAEHPVAVAHAEANPDAGWMCHTRCIPCPGPTRTEVPQ
jgi:hypothetical protein